MEAVVFMLQQHVEILSIQLWYTGPEKPGSRVNLGCTSVKCFLACSRSAAPWGNCHVVLWLQITGAAPLFDLFLISKAEEKAL